MVMCIVVGCASKSDTAKGVGMFRIPSVIYNQGEETEELTKMTLLNESGPRVVDINFSSDSASTSGDVEAMELAH